jgi:hypothetical protein
VPRLPAGSPNRADPHAVDKWVGRHTDVWPTRSLPATRRGYERSSPATTPTQRNVVNELTSRTRQIMGTQRLLVAYHQRGTTRGLRVITPEYWYGSWSQRHDLRCDATDSDGNRLPLQVELRRTRLTYLELHQKPVAHREETLVKDYLARNRGNLATYQKAVAKALSEEIDKARVRGVIAGLTTDELSRARAEPGTVAAEHGVDTATLKRLIAGELDTVMAACVDDGTGPHSTETQPCRASFMQCLSCPCARALM